MQFIIRTLSFINAIFVFFLRVALQIVNKVFYVILIAFAGSPFSCMVDQIDGSYVTAFGAGLVGGMSGQMVSFTVTAKQGSLSKSPVILIPPHPHPTPTPTKKETTLQTIQSKWVKTKIKITKKKKTLKSNQKQSPKYEF